MPLSTTVPLDHFLGFSDESHVLSDHSVPNISAARVHVARDHQCMMPEFLSPHSHAPRILRASVASSFLGGAGEATEVIPRRSNRASVASSFHGEGDGGKKSCPCSGFKGMPGKIQAKMNGEEIEVPADFGSYCHHWDAWHPKCECDNHDPASCKGQEEWCKGGGKNWCYIDPCDCHGGEDAVIASYFPDTTFKGKKVFFSYATCGSSDDYTSKSGLEDVKDACRNKDATECKSRPEKCAYFNGQCMGKDLASAEGTCRNANAGGGGAGCSIL